MSGEFKLNLGLRQGSALSTLVFIIVVEVISRRICRKIRKFRRSLYADGLAMVVDWKADLQEQLIEWEDIFSRHGLRGTLEKTGVILGGREGNSWKYTWMWKSLSKETVLYTWKEQYVGMAIQAPKVAGSLQQV